MPFLNTTPTTIGCGVLSDEYGVPSHWRLFAIILGILGAIFSVVGKIDNT